MSKKYYTSVGSRECPKSIADRFVEVCKRLANENYILRSGGADGIDSYSEFGCDLGCGEKEIYLPFKGFNQNESFLHLDNEEIFGIEILEKSLNLVKDIHPAFDKLTKTSCLLHQRNIHQILGQDLQTPSEFVICYTWNGKAVGGTATAMNLAKRLGIPVYNFYNDGVEKFIELM